jgi:simple sugar transport system permease protein
MRFELREDHPTWLVIAAPSLAILASFLISAVAIGLGGVSPLTAFWHILVGAIGSKVAITETLTRATPLLFTGLSAAVAFRAKLWNIGAEGQLYIAAVVTILIGVGPIDLPGPLLILLVTVAGALAATPLLIGPTVLKTRFGVDEVVTTLLLNFVVILFVSMLLDGPLKDPLAAGWPSSEPVDREARLPLLVPRTRLHAGLLIALATAVIVWIIQTRTVWGFEARAVGVSSTASRFAGVPVERVHLRVACLSASLAGLAGVVEVIGLKGYLTLDLSPGYGFTGIIVATLAWLNPLAVIPAAVFVAGIFIGSDTMSRALGLSNYVAQVITAVSLLSMLVATLFLQYRIRR